MNRVVRDEHHGTRTGYAYGCRCEDCRRYLREYSRAYRARNRQPRRTRSDKGIRRAPVRHGTATAYKHHRCRCDECRTWAATYNRQWRAANRAKSRSYMAVYRATKRPVDVFDAKAREYAVIIAADPCVYCGGQSESIDHIDPVSTSHDHAWDNLAPACMSCNTSKGAKPLLLFLLYRLAATASVA